MTLQEEIKNWQETDAVDLMYKMGIDKGATVIDFGCAKGIYTSAVSNCVTDTGIVYGLDVSSYALKQLPKRKNIVPVHVDGSCQLDFKDNSIDCILIYDLIHQIDSILDTFLKESNRVLKTNGILSVCPFHLSSKEIEKLSNTIQSYGFHFPEVYKNAGLHFEMHEWLHGNRGHIQDIERGNIYNFRKG